MTYQEFKTVFEKSLKERKLDYRKSSRSEYLIKFHKDDVINGDLILFEGRIANGESKIFSEGFQMLSIVTGTFNNVANVSRCPDDREPYVKKVVKESREGYNLFMYKDLYEWCLVGFTTCTSYIGRFEIFSDGSIKVVLECDTVKNEPMKAERVILMHHADQNELLNEFSEVCASHIKIRKMPLPTGWCSWYCYYENISEDLIFKNLNALTDKEYLDYVMIDDGYQTNMGDWLNFSDKFPHGFENLSKSILKAGKKIALWMAPFIASSQSELFISHPEYFVTDENSKPLCSESITYGGWREEPWYMLDFSQQEVCDYIEKVIRFFTDKMKVSAFKLDACYWGCVKGSHYKGGISRVENYRRGLEVIKKACRGKAYILGCNAPMWPSLGLVDAMRITDDIIRDRNRIRELTNQVIKRLYMNRLFTLDPDCLVQKDLPYQKTNTDEYEVLQAMILLSGGSVHSGDVIEELDSHDLEVLKTLCHLNSEKSREVTLGEDQRSAIIKYPELNKLVRVYFNLSDTEFIRLDIEKDCNKLFNGEKVLKGEYVLWPFRALTTVENL